MNKESLYNSIAVGILAYSLSFFTVSYAATETIKTGFERTDYVILYEGQPYPLFQTLQYDGSIVDTPSFTVDSTFPYFIPDPAPQISIATVLAEREAPRWKVLRAKFFIPTASAVSLREEFLAAGGTPEQWEQYQLDLLNQSFTERREKEQKMVKEQLDRSSSSAYAAVLKYLKMDDNLSFTIEIAQVMPDSPAEKAGLQEGDIILSANGESQSILVLADYLQTVNEKTLTYEVGRDADVFKVEITAEVNEITGKYMIGIQGFDNYVLPGEATLSYGEVGGSSAGLIFAIALYEYFTEEDILLKDVKYSGSGAITPDGTVVPIDGLAQKISKAEKTGHNYFFIPKIMCEESEKVETATMVIVPVETFSETVEQLKIISNGEAGQLATCS